MKNPDKRRRNSRIFVVLFMLAAILLAVYGSFVFKEMVQNDELQEKLDEVRQDGR